MWLSVAGGTSFGDDTLPGDRAFALGGPRTLPAYQYDELRARSYWLADVSLLWRLVDLVEVKNQAIYGGFGVQAAGLYDRVDSSRTAASTAPRRTSAGPTPLGTLTLGGGCRRGQLGGVAVARDDRSARVRSSTKACSASAGEARRRRGLPASATAEHRLAPLDERAHALGGVLTSHNVRHAAEGDIDCRRFTIEHAGPRRAQAALHAERRGISDA